MRWEGTELEAITELELEIAAAEEGPEKEELERTLEVCKDLIYAHDEGFVDIEEIDDEDFRIFPAGQSFHAEPIEA